MVLIINNYCYLHLFRTHILLASKASFSQAKCTSGHTNHINGNHNKKLVANVFHNGVVEVWTCDIIACMYIVHQLQHSCCFNDTFIIVLKQLPHAITMEILKKSNMVNYICMYDVQKFSYRRFNFNSLTTLLQLIDFLKCQFIY